MSTDKENLPEGAIPTREEKGAGPIIGDMTLNAYRRITREDAEEAYHPTVFAEIEAALTERGWSFGDLIELQPRELAEGEKLQAAPLPEGSTASEVTSESETEQPQKKSKKKSE